MKSSCAILVCLVAVACLSGCSDDPRGRLDYDFSGLPINSPRVSNLGHGDSVVINVVHTGCIDVRDEFRYEIVGPAPFRVTAHEKVEGQWTPLRGFVLSSADSERLDRLIAFYRHGGMKEVICTSRDRVLIEWSTAAPDTIVEKFLDGSCAAQDDPEIIPLWTLAQRAGAAGYET